MIVRTYHKVEVTVPRLRLSRQHFGNSHGRLEAIPKGCCAFQDEGQVLVHDQGQFKRKPLGCRM